MLINPSTADGKSYMTPEAADKIGRTALVLRTAFAGQHGRRIETALRCASGRRLPGGASGR